VNIFIDIKPFLNCELFNFIIKPIQNIKTHNYYLKGTKNKSKSLTILHINAKQSMNSELINLYCTENIKIWNQLLATKVLSPKFK
jgi:hypothetical protein